MKLKIVLDEHADSPRESYEHLGKMLCFHKRYMLGDKHSCRSSDFAGWDEIAEYIRSELDGAVILPMHMYDHSGLVLSTAPFGDRWDSGQVGFIYITKADLEKEYKSSTAESIAKAESVLVSEVEEYSLYLGGECYGYVIIDDEGEEIQSCWGFYGEKAAREEGEQQLAYYQAEENAKK